MQTYIYGRCINLHFNEEEDFGVWSFFILVTNRYGDESSPPPCVQTPVVIESKPAGGWFTFKLEISLNISGGREREKSVLRDRLADGSININIERTAPESGPGVKVTSFFSSFSQRSECKALSQCVKKNNRKEKGKICAEKVGSLKKTEHLTPPWRGVLNLKV